MPDDLLDRLIAKAGVPLDRDARPGAPVPATVRLEALGIKSVPSLNVSTLPGGSAAPVVSSAGVESRLGRYLIRKGIGSGATGEVFEAYDPELRRIVAIKILRQADADRNIVERFLTEAQVTAQLEHPGIVPVYDFGITDEGRIYLVMKRVHGQSMLELLHGLAQRDASTLEEWPSPRRLRSFAQICGALAYAHSRGVVHRDLKPANIMFGAFGEAVVMDWGIARVEKLVEQPIDRMMSHGTAAGTVLGTVGYMAPEQMLGVRAELGPKCDVWALGVILFELLTAQRAFRGTFEEVCTMVTSGPLEPRGWDPAVLPPELAAVIRRATSVKFAQRPENAAEMAEEINRFMSGA